MQNAPLATPTIIKINKTMAKIKTTAWLERGPKIAYGLRWLKACLLNGSAVLPSLGPGPSGGPNATQLATVLAKPQRAGIELPNCRACKMKFFDPNEMSKARNEK